MVQRGHGTWRLVLSILILLLAVSIVDAVSAAGITLSPRISAPYGLTIANKFGYLNVTNTQSMNSFTDYANGTIVFSLGGWERGQVSYSYLVHSYGNGTLNLIFQTGQVPRVTAALSSSANYAGLSETVQYNTLVASDPLILTFLGNASQQLFNAAVYASFFFGVILTSIGVLYGITMFAQVWKGLDVITGEHTPKPTISTTQVTIVALMVIIGFGIMIIIAVFFGNVLKGAGS